MTWLLGIGLFGSIAQGAPVVQGARLVLQPGHSKEVVTAVYSADGTRVVTGGQDGTAIVWHAASGAGLQRLEGHDGHVAGAAFSADGSRLVTFGDFREAVAVLWDPERGTRLFDWPHDDTPEDAAFTPDGARVAIGTGDGTGALWDVATGQLVAKLAEGEGEAGALSRVSPNGTRLFTQKPDRNGVAIWDTATGKVVSHVVDENGVIYGVFSADGSRLFTTDRDNKAKLWDTATGKLVKKLKGKGYGPKVAVFSADGKWVAEVSKDMTGPTMVWSTATGKVVMLPKTTDADRYVDIAFTPDDRVVTGHSDRSVRVHDTAGQELRRFEVPGAEYHDVRRVVVAPNGVEVVALDDTASVWDLTDGHLVHRLAGAALGVRDATWARDGRRIATANLDPSATVWDLVGGSPEHRLVGEDKPLWTVAFSADGANLLTGAQFGTSAWWDVHTGAALQTIPDHEGPTYTTDVIPDGTRALTGGLSGKIHEWNTASGTRIVELDGFGGNVIAARYSGDGRRLYTASTDGVVAVRDRQSGTVLERMELGPLVCAAFSADGKRVLTAGREGKFDVRDVATSRVLQHYEGNTVSACAFAPDGQRIAVGSWEGMAAVYAVSKSGLLARLDGHSGRIYSVEFSPDGRSVLTGSLDGTARLWDAGTGKERLAFMSFADGGWAAVDPDGRFDASEDGRVSGLVWVIDGEPYALDQLREQYYEPGLVAKVMKLRPDPVRSVPPLSSIRPPPQVKLVDPGTSGKLEIEVEDRGGGVGRVFVRLNASDITEQVTAACPDLAAGGTCTIDLAELPTWKPGEENQLEAFASVANGAVRSRGTVREVVAEGEKVTDPPDLWVLAVGSGDYAGDRLDLQYAGFDALQFARAIEVAGERGFGADRTHVRVLSTDPGEESEGRPRKDTLREAVSWMDSADAGDTFVLFLSGHGVALADDYFYVLPDAGAFEDLTDPAARAQKSWSGQEISEALAQIRPLKRVVILDTCAAGKLDVSSLAAPRALSSDAVRAHARVQERTGAWFLAGAAADQVSYEASRYGEGVLTYALLEGMRGPALDDADLLYVSRLFAHAENQVPIYAEGIGGIQKPVIRTAEAGDFVLGQLAQEDRGRVPLQQVKPVVVRARVVPVGGRADRLGIESAINAGLRAKAEGADAPFVVWNSDGTDDTWQFTGTYAEKPGSIQLTGFLTRSKGSDVDEIAISASGSDSGSVASSVVEQVADKVK